MTLQRSDGSTKLLRKHLPQCSEDAGKKHANAIANKPMKPSTPKAVNTSKMQPSIKGFLMNSQKWKYDDPRSVAIDLSILQWMCLNCKPLSEVEKPGFADIFSSANPQ